MAITQRWDTTAYPIHHLPEIFRAAEPGQAGLGDTGNDMIIYGSKLYVVMNGTSQVTVINASTGSLIRRIDFVDGANPKSPRYATAARGRVFVTSYDNTVSVIDTSSLSIVGSVTVGANPDGIAATNNYLYVANSGSYNFPDVDSTVSVIDINTLTETRKITVGKNPNKIEVAPTVMYMLVVMGIFHPSRHQYLS